MTDQPTTGDVAVTPTGIDIVTGPVERVGAAGTLTSVYVRDPDGNLIGVGTYDDAT